MSAAEEIDLQTQILGQMEGAGRLAYRGPLVLEMSVDTTVRNPPQAHSIAKNLLDLFSTPRPELEVGRKLLYGDDEQIHGLSVSCHHGCPRPRINLVATPLTSFRADLELALRAERALGRERPYDAPDALDEALEHLRDLLQNAQAYREVTGPGSYESMQDFARFRAQEELLGGTATTLIDLAAMYQVLPRNSFIAPVWERLNRQLVDYFKRHRLRIHLDELPSKPGTSDQYLRDVAAQIDAFRHTWEWVLKPLRIPVALQVITRPSPPVGKDPPKHDLDNVVRSYVVPQVVAAFAPPSDLAWTLDLSRLPAEQVAWWEKHRKGIPREPQIRRYEAWRLPVDGTRGFVSVSLIPDIGNLSGPIMRMDALVDEWQESREEDEW